MRSPWALLANLLVALCLVIFQAPQPCQGDLAGNPCSTEACACVTSCSCQVGHERARALSEVLTGLPSCCRSDRDVHASAEAAVTASMGCHAGEAPAHFALGDGAGPMLVAAPAPGAVAPGRAARPRAPTAYRPDAPPSAFARPPWA